MVPYRGRQNIFDLEYGSLRGYLNGQFFTYINSDMIGDNLIFQNGVLSATFSGGGSNPGGDVNQLQINAGGGNFGAFGKVDVASGIFKLNERTDPSGLLNTFVGFGTGEDGVVGSGNTLIGRDAGNLLSTGSNNTLVGYRAGWRVEENVNNTIFGNEAGSLLNTGDGNVMMGEQAGRDMNGGSNNVLVGKEAGAILENGDGNVVIGAIANQYNINGDNNVFIGVGSGPTITSVNNTIALGGYAEPLSDGEIAIGSANLGFQKNTAGTASVSPVLYLEVRVNGTLYKIPLHN